MLQRPCGLLPIFGENEQMQYFRFVKTSDLVLQQLDFGALYPEFSLL